MGHMMKYGREEMSKDEFVKAFGSYRVNDHTDTLMGDYKVTEKLGTGSRFKKLKGVLAKKGVRNPGAVAAYIGRKKYGKEKFQKLAAKGRAKKY